MTYKGGQKYFHKKKLNIFIIWTYILLTLASMER